MEKIGESAYRLQLPDRWRAIHPVFNESLLTPRRSPVFASQKRPAPPPPDIINNEAEYEALITGLKLAKELGISTLQVFSDSQLIVTQVNRECEARDPSMIKYLAKVHELLVQLLSCQIQQISRSANAQADRLAKLATFRTANLDALGHIEILETSSIEEPLLALCTAT